MDSGLLQKNAWERRRESRKTPERSCAAMSRRKSGALRRPAHSAASRFPLPLVVNPRECGTIENVRAWPFSVMRTCNGRSATYHPAPRPAASPGRYTLLYVLVLVHRLPGSMRVLLRRLQQQQEQQLGDSNSRSCSGIAESAWSPSSPKTTPTPSLAITLLVRCPGA